MGACPSTNMTPEQKAKYDEEQQKERIIARAMNDEKVQDQRCFKLLLLGTGESGKSTLFKQMLQIYGKGISQEELQTLLPTIHANLYIGMVALCQHCEQWGQVAPENEEAFRYFQSQVVAPDTNTWSLEPLQFNYIQQLWADPAIQTAWLHRSEYQIYDSTEYFMNKIGQIDSPKYQVSNDDYLRLRVRTTGIVESDFVIDGNQFRLHDVGGQRNERKKWIHCFENVTAVIFVAAMSEYDQRLLEDETTNRLQETLDLFSDICNSKWFTKTAMLLFLNKRDLFEEKLTRIPLTKYFPAYTGDNDYQSAQKWMQLEFVSKSNSKDQKLYPYCTTAIDTNNVRAVFNTTKDIILRQALQGLGVA